MNEFISLRSLANQWVFISTICDLTNANSTKFFFHLWGYGGASWTSEAAQFQEEEDASWTLVTRRNRRPQRSYAEVVKSPSQLTGANRVPLGNPNGKPKQSVFDRLTFQRNSVFDRVQFLSNDLQAKNKEVLNLNESRALNSNTNNDKETGPGPESKDGLFCGRCLQYGHHWVFCRGQLICIKCGSAGHFARFCKALSKNLVYPKKKPRILSRIFPR